MKKVMIVAGEASGDLHGSNLIKAVNEIEANISFYGVGGKKIEEAGAEILIDSAELAVVGISEVIPNAGKILGALALLKKRLSQDNPSLLILIDFPDFNLMLAKHAKKVGVPVLYYISPQVWAWRKGRVNKIAQRVDRMAVVFPFEVPLYEKFGLHTLFVGHPLIDAVNVSQALEDIKKGLGIEEDKKVIGLLPGSRSKEIKSLLPAMLESAEIMASRSPEFIFVLPLAHTVKRELIDEILPLYNVDVKIVEGMTYDIMKISDMAFIASARFIALPNIVAERSIIPELIQDEANPGRMVEEAFNILFGKGTSERMKADLNEVREKLGGAGASRRTAELVVEMVDGQELL
jgi:lipid-A-disaccharide synthase